MESNNEESPDRSLKRRRLAFPGEGVGGAIRAGKEAKIVEQKKSIKRKSSKQGDRRKQRSGSRRASEKQILLSEVKKMDELSSKEPQVEQVKAAA